jgi:hypothetical protein
MHSVRWPKNNAAASASSALGTLGLYELVAAARKEWFEGWYRSPKLRYDHRFPVVLALGLGRGKVCAKRAISAKRWSVRWKRMGGLLFWDLRMTAFPRGRPMTGHVVTPSCQRSARLKKPRLGAPLVTYQSSAHSAGPRWATECSVEGMESQFCFRMNSLQRTRNHGAVSAQRALSSRASCKLVAAARKWGSVLSRAASSWRDGADR